MIATLSPAGMAWYATKGKYRAPSHIKALNDVLLDVALGREKRVILNFPPRHGKSTLTSRYFPAWFVSKFKKKVILASYEATFAASWGQAARDTVIQYGPPLFNVRVREDMSASNNWGLLGHEGAGMQTAGIGGPLTGKGGNLIIIDDPIKNVDEAKSAVRRNGIWEWYTAVARTRLEPGGAIIVIMTRWNSDDLVGRLEQEAATGGEKWRVLTFRAIAGGDDPLGRAPGSPLWPEWFDLPELKSLKRTLGPYYWAALYQQSPVAESGNVFLGKWFGTYENLPKGYQWRIIIWDTAFKEKQSSDYSACLVMSLREGSIYIEFGFRDRITYPELKRKAKSFYEIFLPDEVCVEDKASGQSLIQDLKVDEQIPFPIIAIPAESDKVSRAHAVTGICEAGRVLLPKDGGEWVEDLLNEVIRFPNADKDDFVDCLVHGITRLRDRAFPPSEAGPDDESRDAIMRSYHSERGGRSRT